MTSGLDRSTFQSMKSKEKKEKSRQKFEMDRTLAPESWHRVRLRGSARAQA